MKHYAFPKIVQYHQCLKTLTLREQYAGKDEEGNPIYDYSKNLPTIEFEGRIKHHGTNAAIVFDIDGNFYCQSRERIINPESDNAGFAAWAQHNGAKIWENVKSLYNIDGLDHIIVYGEWCGGNIQSGVALNALSKMFIVFGVKTVKGETAQWENFDGIENPEIGVYSSTMFPSYNISIDLNNPQAPLEDINKLVDAVDKECPFCKEIFGVSGVGEGIVWTISGTNNFDYAFKTKGESHSKSKIRKPPTVDPVQLANMQNAIELYCNEDRMQQVYDKIVLTDDDKIPQNIGEFVRLVIQDAWDEEGDSLLASGIERKTFGGAISKKAANWFKIKIM